MEEFIGKTMEQIRCARAREYVAKELKDHILDQAKAYEEKGADKQEAVGRAVREMGDPVEIGVELDRIHRPQTDYKLIGMACLFGLGGMFVLYTVGGLSKAPEELFRQCLCLLLSFGVMAGMYFLDYTFIGKYAYAIYVFMTAAFFLVTKLAWNMLSVAGQIPDMLMFVYLYIPVFAGILYRMRGKGYGAVVACIVLQVAGWAFIYRAFTPSHAGLVVYGICMVLLLCAVRKGWFAVNKKSAAAVVIGIMVLMPAAFIVARLLVGGRDSFMFMRLQGYINPEKDASGAGYMYLYIRQRLAAAKLIGSSVPSTFMEEYSIGEPYIYRTEPFILLELVCRYGILAGAAVVSMFVAVAVRAFRIVRRQKNQLGYMISVACFMVFLVNCVEGVLMNTGYYPVSSMQLPFVSYGAGATITYAVLIGLLLSIYRNEKIVVRDVSYKRPAWRLSVRLEKR